jgi:hypothetical protein
VKWGTAHPGDENDKCYGELAKAVNIQNEYTRMRVATPKELSARLREAFQSSHDCVDGLIREADARTAREKRNRELAAKDIDSVRGAIGLPPLPKS